MTEKSWTDQGREAAVHPISNLDWELVFWDPHTLDEYRNPQYRPAIAQFLREDTAIFQLKPQLPNGLTYDYSDRLVEYDKEKAKSAWQSVLERGTKPKTGRFVQEYLSAYYDRSVKLWRIGVTMLNTGWPVRSYGYEYQNE